MITAPDVDPDTPSQSARLTAFFAGLPLDAEVQFPPDRDYQCDQTVPLIDKRLSVDLNGSLLHTADTTGDGMPYGEPDQQREWAIRARDHLHLLRSHVAFHNGAVRGAKPRTVETLGADYEAQHGIGLQNSTVELHDFTITDVNGDGVCLHRAPGDPSPSSANIGPNTVIDRVGRSGVSMQVAQHVHVGGKGAYIGNTARSTFDFEPLLPSWFVDDVTIDGLRVGNGRLLFIASSVPRLADGRVPGRVDNIKVGHVELDRPMNMRIGGVRDAKGRSNRNGWDINNSHAHDVFGTTGPAAPCVFTSVDDLVFAGNSQPMQRGRPHLFGIALTDCHQVVEYVNSFPGAEGPAWQRGTTNEDVRIARTQLVAGGPYI